MVGLGVWQLQRKSEKEALLARYEAAAGLPEIAWPRFAAADDPHLFRRATGFCLEVTGWRTSAGQNLRGETGWSHIVGCRTGAEGPGMQVDMGWSKNPAVKPRWAGGAVRGTIVPDPMHRIRLVSAVPAPGLVASAAPSSESIPNNHLLYAIQWFFFAAAATVIYMLALRRRSPPKA